MYDITVTVTCQGQGPIEGVTAGSVGQLEARLSCVAQSQRSSEAQSFSPYAASGCRMGRLEVYNPSARHADGNGQGTWGTVCKLPRYRWHLGCILLNMPAISLLTGGHWFWDNDNAAGVACRQMGFADGFMYTFGATTLLP